MERKRPLTKLRDYLLNQEIYDREFILKTMNDPVLNRPGLLNRMMQHNDVLRKVSVCFSTEELVGFYLEYTKQCIIQNKEDEIVPSPYIAAGELKNWVMNRLKNHAELLDIFVSMIRSFTTPMSWLKLGAVIGTRKKRTIIKQEITEGTEKFSVHSVHSVISCS